MKLLIILLSAFGAILSAPTYAQDIVLGQSVPLSGPVAEVGRDMRDGAMAVFAKVNASGGVGGRKIKLVSLDNANNRAKALENTKQLIDVDGAVALFGYNSATTSLDALPLLKQNDMALFAPFTGSPSARDHDHVFTVRASYSDEAAKIAELMKSTGLSKAAVVYYDDEAGKSNVQMVSSAFAANEQPRVLAVKRNAKLGAAEFAGLLNDKPHYIIFTTQASVVGDYMQAAQAKGINTPVTTLSFVVPDELARTYGTVARGAIVSQVVPSPGGAMLYKNGTLRDCAKLLKDFNGAELNFTSLESCIAAKAIVNVIQKSGAKRLTRSILLKGFQTAGRVDLDGFALNYANSRHGSKYVDITFLSRESMFQKK